MKPWETTATTAGLAALATFIGVLVLNNQLAGTRNLLESESYKLQFERQVESI